MKFSNSFHLDFEKNNSIYFKLLKEEDFDFKTKEINIEINENKDGIHANIDASSVMELKIGNSAFIKSLEIITKTLNV